MPCTPGPHSGLLGGCRFQAGQVRKTRAYHPTLDPLREQGCHPKRSAPLSLALLWGRAAEVLPMERGRPQGQSASQIVFDLRIPQALLTFSYNHTAA